MTENRFGWLGVLRLGLVQTSLGAIVVLTTSTINRVMVVELALPAMVPGALVALHYALQILRPRVGHGSDVSRRRTPWIAGGMAMLAIGGITASLAAALMTVNLTAGLLLAVLAFVAIGGGVSAAGTTLLVLLAKLTPAPRRPAAATIVWLMMIAGFAVTAIVAGQFLDPFSFGRLVAVTTVISTIAVIVTVLAVRGVESSAVAAGDSADSQHSAERAFLPALKDTWSDPRARLFTIFIFMSMLAYSMQDLILEPFAGIIFGYTPGQSTSLSGVHHGGVFVGMIAIGICGTAIGGKWLGSSRFWMVTGCIASALALGGIIVAALSGAAAALRPCIFALGIANGAFAIAAIATMMSMAGEGGAGREGIRMGLWGAAQGIAFGLGGFIGTFAIDVARVVIASPHAAYATVFAIEAAIFLVAAVIAVRLDARNAWSAVGLPELFSKFAHRPVGHRSEVEGRP
jgi:BCD family chlorophyll transporter-like MFS transporter